MGTPITTEDHGQTESTRVAPLAPGRAADREEAAAGAAAPALTAGGGSTAGCGHGGCAAGDPPRAGSPAPHAAAVPRATGTPGNGWEPACQPSLRRRQRPTKGGCRVLNYLPRHIARTPLPTQSFLQTKGFSAPALLTAGARSLSVHCGVLGGTPALHPPDTSSCSSPR